MQTKDNIINFLKENKQIIQEKYAVNKIALLEVSLEVMLQKIVI